MMLAELLLLAVYDVLHGRSADAGGFGYSFVSNLTSNTYVRITNS